MVKLIVRDKEIGGEKKLVEVNNIADIATILFDEEDEEVTYQYCNIDINNPKLENSNHLNDIWKSLKDDTKKLTLFEFVDKIFLSQDFIFRLSETYEQDGKLILPIALEPYAEEAIVYVINSCINGKIDGYFKIEKATNDMMRFAKRRNNEMKYLDWQNDIIDMVAHDFRSNEYYGIVAMEKLIKKLQNKNLEDAKNKTIDFLFNDEDMLKYIYLSNSMTENKVSLSFYTNSLGDKFIKREPKSIYRDFVIYKNIPVYKMGISSSFYEIEIDENGFYVCRELSKEQVKLVIGK